MTAETLLSSPPTIRPRSATVFAEVYSTNLGDPLIYHCLSEMLQASGVATRGEDISGRTKDGNTRRNQAISNLKDTIASIIPKFLLDFFTSIRRSVKRHRRYSYLIEDSDFIIFGGGQLLKSGNWPFLISLLHISLISLRKNKPFFIHACGVSSTQWGRVSKMILRLAQRKASWVSVRDPISGRVFEDITGRKPRIVLDPGFYLGNLVERKQLNRHCVGICIQHIDDFSQFLDISLEQYRKIIYKTISLLSQRGVSVMLFTNGNIKDQHAADKIFSGSEFSDVKMQVHPRCTCLRDYISMIENFDAVIATRLHATIAAFSLGKPFAGFQWDAKVRDVWNYVDNLDCIFPLNEKGAEDAVSYVLSANDSFEKSRACGDRALAGTQEMLRHV